MSEQNLSGIARDLIDAFNARNSEQFEKQLTNTVVYDEIETNRKFQGPGAYGYRCGSTGGMRFPT